MTQVHERSFFGELLNRRVPQILGLYVAATWMGVEIGEWLSERFALPQTVSSFIFVGMLALLPSVALLAWGHGAPGRDRWTRFQAVFMSLNVILAGAAMMSLVRPPAVIAATETRVITDETGAEVEYEVAKEGFHQRLLAFFWNNESGDPELDWISYGAPLLLVEDLVRSPLISASTPFSSSLVIDRFRATGFDRAIGEPLSLDLQIARERGLRHIVTGRIDRATDGLLLTARVYEIESGELLGEWSAAGANWLESIDQLSTQISEALLPVSNSPQIVPNLSVSEHVSASIPAIRAVVDGLQLWAFDNDYAGALAAVEKAVELDPTFAEAFVFGMQLSRLSGDMTTALSYAQRALSLDYKLYSERKFVVKANSYGLQLQTDKAIRVLEMWTEVHPNSAEAFKLLAQNLMIVDDRLDEAGAAVEKVLELDPSDQRQLLNLAQIYRLQGRLDDAVAVIERYLADHPDDVDAYRSLAGAQIQSGALDAARAAYEKAAILDPGDPIADLDLAKLAIREGDDREAYRIIEDLERKELTERQRYEVLKVKRNAYLHSGRISGMLEVLAEQAPLGSKFMPPLAQLFDIGMFRASAYALRGERERALAVADELRANLQPPLDSVALFAHLAVYQELEEQEAFDETLATLTEFNEQFQFPFLETFLLSARAQQQRWSGDMDGALASYEHIIDKASRSALSLAEPTLVESMLLEKAETLNEAGRPDAAAEVLQTVLTTNPGQPQAHLELARAHAARGRLAEAHAEFDIVRARWSEADPEFLYLERLERLEAQLEAATN